MVDGEVGVGDMERSKGRPGAVSEQLVEMDEERRPEPRWQVAVAKR